MNATSNRRYVTLALRDSDSEVYTIHVGKGRLATPKYMYFVWPISVLFTRALESTYPARWFDCAIVQYTVLYLAQCIIG